MKVPYSWLLELVEGIPSTQQTADLLTMRGFEVEEIICPGAAIESIIVAQILEQKPHPDADKLTLCQVTDGTQKYAIVCGAKNMKPGDKVALAKLGTTLPGNFTIEKRKIRGYFSEGMMCSARELGLGDDHAGIMILPETSRLGARFIDEMGLSETVFEINVTPNRPDALCMRGIARELAAACGGKLRQIPISPIPPGREAGFTPSVILEDEDLCLRYSAVIIQEVKIGPSPDWLKQRLESFGMRSVNNVVDATNLVMMELGQPLHAFDLDRLNEKRIVVRRAKPDERIVTIDGDERILSDSMLVIADAKNAVAVAGVMGGLHSEVSENTTAVLLESAYFHPASVRRTAKQLGLPSEASYRFERGVDFETVIPASWRCTQRILELAGGVVVGNIGVADTRKVEKIRELQGRELTMRFSYCRRLLGKAVTPEEIERIFVSLQIPVVNRNAETITLGIPSFRNDLRREADLAEEIARCHGYDKFTPTLMTAVVKTPESQEIDRTFTQRLRQYLIGLGLDESVTYSFTDAESLQPFTPEGISLTEDEITLRNPINSREATMRSSLLPSLLHTAKRNCAHGNLDFGLFEIGRKYLPAHEEVEERYGLAVILVGNPQFTWRHSRTELDFFDAKGIAEGILQLCSLHRYRWVNGPFWLHPKRGASIQASKQIIASLGELHPQWTETYELPGRVLLLDFELKPLIDAFRAFSVQYRPFSIYPAIKRDLALLVPGKVTAKQIEEIIAQESGTLLEDLVLFDYYRGKQVAEGFVGLGFRMTFRSLEETLKEETIDTLHQAMVARLQKELGVQLRS